MRRGWGCKRTNRDRFSWTPCQPIDRQKNEFEFSGSHIGSVGMSNEFGAGFTLPDRNGNGPIHFCKALSPETGFGGSFVVPPHGNEGAIGHWLLECACDCDGNDSPPGTNVIGGGNDDESAHLRLGVATLRVRDMGEPNNRALTEIGGIGQGHLPLGGLTHRLGRVIIAGPKLIGDGWCFA